MPGAVSLIEGFQAASRIREVEEDLMRWGMPLPRGGEEGGERKEASIDLVCSRSGDDGRVDDEDVGEDEEDEGLSLGEVTMGLKGSGSGSGGVDLGEVTVEVGVD